MCLNRGGATTPDEQATRVEPVVEPPRIAVDDVRGQAPVYVTPI
jgi:hypothetical protein